MAVNFSFLVLFVRFFAQEYRNKGKTQAKAKFVDSTKGLKIKEE
jgi:hypothetical protein